MFDNHENLVLGSVTVAPSPPASGTTLEMSVGDAALFPDPTAVGEYNVTIWPANEMPQLSNAEIVRITAKSGVEFTITREQEDTSARTILVGDKIAITITKKVVKDIEDALLPKELAFEPSVDLSASGLIITVTVDSNSVGVGCPLFLAADGHFDEADADASTTSPAVVLALEAGTGSKKVLVHGILRNDAWNWTTGPGKASLIYLDTTTGTLTQTQPSGTDDVVQPVGWALSDDCIYFCPSLIYFTHT